MLQEDHKSEAKLLKHVEDGFHSALKFRYSDKSVELRQMKSKGTVVAIGRQETAHNT